MAGCVCGRVCQMEQSQDTRSTAPGDDDTLDGCIWLTEEQIDAMMRRLNNDSDSEANHHRREKRAFTDFRRSPFSRWSMPITYKFDGAHCERLIQLLLSTVVYLASIDVCTSL